jgi:predicted DNA-binding transcriptional regulator YafY
MVLQKKIDVLLRMDALIRRRGTGDPQMFAERLNVAPSTLYNYINELKSLGAPIMYEKSRLSYYYTEPMRLIFECKYVKDEELVKTK